MLHRTTSTNVSVHARWSHAIGRRLEHFYCIQLVELLALPSVLRDNALAGNGALNEGNLSRDIAHSASVMTKTLNFNLDGFSGKFLASALIVSHSAMNRLLGDLDSYCERVNLRGQTLGKYPSG